MTRKRFIRLCMTQISRNDANHGAWAARVIFKNYKDAWETWCGEVRGRF